MIHVHVYRRWLSYSENRDKSDFRFDQINDAYFKLGISRAPFGQFHCFWPPLGKKKIHVYPLKVGFRSHPLLLLLQPILQYDYTSRHCARQTTVSTCNRLGSVGPETHWHTNPCLYRMRGTLNCWKIGGGSTIWWPPCLVVY